MTPKKVGKLCDCRGGQRVRKTG